MSFVTFPKYRREVRVVEGGDAEAFKKNLEHVLNEAEEPSDITTWDINGVTVDSFGYSALLTKVVRDED
jgi:hypothetical protein